MKASVIVLNFNGERWLEGCLSSILKQEFDDDFEVIVVDNGSTDESLNWAKQRFPVVRFVELGSNYGFAQGNNIGAAHAEGDYLVFVNMDTEAKDGWLINLVRTADKCPEYQILCSIQLPSQEANRARVLNVKGYPMPSPYESKHEITDSTFASGACFLIRKEFIKEIGYLFDPFYFSYAEDLELSLRTILLDGRIGYVKKSRIFHYGGGANLPVPRAAYFSMRNLLLTYYKLFSLENFMRILLVQILYTVARLFARKQQLKTTFGMMRGIFSSLANMHRYMSYRRAFLPKKMRNDRYVFDRFFYRGKLEEIILKRVIYGCRT